MAGVLCDRPACRDWFAEADPRNDTIKVDLSRFDKQHILQFHKENGIGPYKQATCKENVKPPPLEVATFQAALQERQQQEEARRRALQRSQEQDAARARREERRRSFELERQEAERREAERLEVERLEEERCEAERMVAEALLEQEQERVREEMEEQALENARTEEARIEQQAQAAENERMLDDFLSSKGYSSVNAKRTKMFKSKYPLHSAVKDNSLELVKLLLAAQADPSLRSSAGLSPAHLAMKLSMNGSHDDIICALQRVSS